MKATPRIYLSPPDISGNEQEYVKQAFDDNWVAPVGPHLDLFEKKIEARYRDLHAVALTSGTAAIHLGLKLLGVSKGDFVICQSFTFSGSANPITYVGAEPVFVDSEKDTWNMDPDLLEEAILQLLKKGNLPKAIIPVHLYGMPAKMQEIITIAAKYKIPLLEDAAEAFGSFYDNRPCGDLGDVGILSFNGNKIITTSGGGALISRNKEIVDKARFYATQSREPLPYYEHQEIGYNYRLSNVSAAIGVGQVESLDHKIQKRRENFLKYQEYFERWNSRGISMSFQEGMINMKSNRWLTCVLLPIEAIKDISPEKILNALAKQNIEARHLWKPMHQQPVFRESTFFGGEVCASFFERGICLPSGSSLRDSDFSRIFEALDSVFQ